MTTPDRYGRLTRGREIAIRDRVVRERTELVIWCRKKGRHRQKMKDLQESQDTPKILTSEDIRDLGGLRNAVRVLNNSESRKNTKVTSPTNGKRFRNQKKTPGENEAERDANTESNTTTTGSKGSRYYRHKNMPGGIAMESEGYHPRELDDAPQHLKNLYGSDMTENPEGLVIDGYNLLAEMAKQEKRRFNGKEFRERREMMEEDISIYSQGRGFRTCIVYDAVGNRYSDESMNRQSSYGMDIVYCTEYEADFGLKIEADRYLAEGTRRITVVTSDNDARDTCIQPPMVDCQSSDFFLSEVQKSKRDLDMILQDQETTSKEAVLRDAMPEDTLSELQELRNALIEEHKKEP